LFFKIFQHPEAHVVTGKFHVKHLIPAAVGIMIASIVATSVVSAFFLREREIETWRRQVANLYLVMAEQTTQTMSSARIAMECIAERIDAMGIRNESELRSLMKTGGDEFVAVLLDLADEESSLITVERLIHTASRQIHLGDIVVQISASLSVTFYPQSEAVDPDQLLCQADHAMYQAKLLGMIRYCIFREKSDAGTAL
jgi:hypothetical protein